MGNLYEIYCADGKVDGNKKMKSFLLINFRDNLQFKPAHEIHGNPKIVHSVEVNPVVYALTSIILAGLKDKEIILVFARIINHKPKYQALSKNVPSSVKKFMKKLDKYDPFKEIFNAVSLSCSPTVPINDFGYTSTKSLKKANKIW